MYESLAEFQSHLDEFVLCKRHPLITFTMPHSMIFLKQSKTENVACATNSDQD